MHWKRQQQYVDAMLMAKIEITQEELFWIRMERGRQFLRTHYPDQVEAFEATPAFWNWWQQIWLMRDKDLLEWLEKEGIQTKPDAKWYAQSNEVRHFRYRPNNEITKAMYCTMQQKHADAEAYIMQQVNEILQPEVQYA